MESDYSGKEGPVFGRLFSPFTTEPVWGGVFYFEELTRKTLSLLSCCFDFKLTKDLTDNTMEIENKRLTNGFIQGKGNPLDGHAAPNA